MWLMEEQNKMDELNNLFTNYYSEVDREEGPIIKNDNIINNTNISSSKKIFKLNHYIIFYRSNKMVHKSFCRNEHYFFIITNI